MHARQLVYRNATFGLNYKPPYGWVERTDEMQADDSNSKAQDLSPSKEPKTPKPHGRPASS